jgi:hypothetical protein
VIATTATRTIRGSNENKGKVKSPNGGQNSLDQEKKRDIVAGHDVVWTGEEEAAEVIRRPDSLFHISR